MNIPEARASRNLIGHDRALDLFERSFSQGTLPHAWLLCGPAGIGKETFAFHCARKLLRIEAGSTEEKRLLAGTHEGIITLKRDHAGEEGGVKKRDISVDDIRRLSQFFQRASGLNVWRVAIIDGAENLSISAANALLKLIEEPPPHSIFFLITSRLGYIQDTIRSRCHIVKLSPLSNQDMRHLIPDISDELLDYAKGAPKVAFSLLRKEYAEIPVYIQSLFAGEDSLAGLKEKLTRLKQEEAISLFYAMLKDKIAEKSRESIQNRKYDEARDWAQKYFTLQAMLSDAERFSLEKDQVLTEILELLCVEKRK